MLGAFLLLHFKYKVDEDTHAQIVKELEERHIAAEKEEEAKGE